MRQESLTGLKLRPPGDHGGVHHGGVMLEEDMAGAQDTIYLCNFRVSVDGEWLCLKELQDVEFSLQDSMRSPSPPLALSGINYHHDHDHHHHHQQQLSEQRKLRDTMPPSPPPLQHVSSLCLYSMLLHSSVLISGIRILEDIKFVFFFNFCSAKYNSFLTYYTAYEISIAFFLFTEKNIFFLMLRFRVVALCGMHFSNSKTVAKSGLRLHI